MRRLGRALAPPAIALAGLLGCTPGLGELARTASRTPPTDGVAAWRTECGACHLAYPPQLMPERSWRAVMLGLPSHYGEDASLDPATTDAIVGFLVSHAADSVNGDAAFLRGLSANDTPLRVTDMPFWRAIHYRQLQTGAGAGPGIRSSANCLTCHGSAALNDD